MGEREKRKERKVEGKEGGEEQIIKTLNGVLN